MDNKRTPRRSTPTKKNLLGSLLTFFGLGQKSRRSPKTGRKLWFAPSSGNKALPTAMQAEVMVCARNKRIRKDDLRKSVHHMQKKLGHHKFT